MAYSPEEEAVARAICDAQGLDPDRKAGSGFGGEEWGPVTVHWHEFIREARAAIAALDQIRSGAQPDINDAVASDGGVPCPWKREPTEADITALQLLCDLRRSAAIAWISAMRSDPDNPPTPPERRR